MRKDDARRFYEAEAIRGGWSVRQLERQIDTQFYERALLSRKQTAVLAKGQTSVATDVVTADEEVKDPYILEFLNLKNEYSGNRSGGRARCQPGSIPHGTRRGLHLRRSPATTAYR